MNTRALHGDPRARGDTPGRCEVTGHSHRWRIESPDGRPLLPGRCECGAERLFIAAAADMTPNELLSVKVGRPGAPPRGVARCPGCGEGYAAGWVMATHRKACAGMTA